MQRRLIAPNVRRPIALVSLQGRQLSIAAQAVAGLLHTEVLRVQQTEGA